jgi:hypothetical protein
MPPRSSSERRFEYLSSDLRPEVGHAAVVDIREREALARGDLGRVLVNGLVLAPEISGGLRHAGDEVGVDVGHRESFRF